MSIKVRYIGYGDLVDPDTATKTSDAIQSGAVFVTTPERLAQLQAQGIELVEVQPKKGRGSSGERAKP